MLFDKDRMATKAQLSRSTADSTKTGHKNLIIGCVSLLFSPTVLKM